MQYNFSTIAQVGLWILVVVVALIMQVVPLLLVLTIFNMAIGVSSSTMLVVIPAVLFGSIVIACCIAERRRRSQLPVPLPTRTGSVYPSGDMRNMVANMLPHLKRDRFR